MTPAAQVWSAADAAAWITPPREDDDKYARGVVGFATGSLRYPGAAVIGVDAALHAGIGMVRYLGPDAVGRLVLERRPETVLETGRVQAWVIGSGHDGASGEAPQVPIDEAVRILDAGAIGAAADTSWPAIATPHAGELAQLLGVSRAEVVAHPIAAARRGAEELGAVVLLKGATTYVTDGDRVVAVHEATPWLATAGAGDSLAGILGALVAARAARGDLDLDALVPLGATAAFLHGRAARLAAHAEPDGSGGGPFTILELNAALPAAVRSLLAAR